LFKKSFYIIYLKFPDNTEKQVDDEITRPSKEKQKSPILGKCFKYLNEGFCNRPLCKFDHNISKESRLKMRDRIVSWPVTFTNV